MSPLEAENFQIEDWDFSLENSKLDFENLDDLLEDQDFQTLPTEE